MRIEFEIVETARDRQISGPVVGVALEHEALAGLDLRDPIGSRADWNLQRLIFEMLRIGMGARQHRHHRQSERQLAVVGARKIIAHSPIVRRVDALDEPKGGALLRAALGLQEVEGEEDIGGGDRRSVREPGVRIEMKDEPVPRFIGLEAFCYEAVEGERLVGRARHQGLIDVADEALRGRQGLHVVGVQTVERAKIGEVEPPALGRLRVDVRQVVEVGRQRRTPMHRNRAHRWTDTARGWRRRRRQGGPERCAKGIANRAADHCRILSSAASRYSSQRSSLGACLQLRRIVLSSGGSRAVAEAVSRIRRRSVFVSGLRNRARGRRSGEIVIGISLRM